MSVEFWTGGPFEHTHERAAQEEIIKTFYSHFGAQNEPLFTIFNVSVNGADIDVLVLKHDALIILELKECSQPVHATENGLWKIMTGGALQSNPFKQVRDFRYRLDNYLGEKSSAFLTNQKSRALPPDHPFLKSITCIVTLCPSIHPDSQIDIDHRVHRWFHITGLNDLPSKVRNITSNALKFNESELRTLVSNVLRCDPLYAVPGEGTLPDDRDVHARAPRMSEEPNDSTTQASQTTFADSPADFPPAPPFAP